MGLPSMEGVDARCETDGLADPCDPAIEALVRDVIGQVADKWTMLILETLEEHGTLRFTHLGRLVGGISQKMLTKTVRQMECDGLVARTVHPVIPPHVDYSLTELGRSLGGAFCGVWLWAETHHAAILKAREAFNAPTRQSRPSQRAAPRPAAAPVAKHPWSR